MVENQHVHGNAFYVPLRTGSDQRIHRIGHTLLKRIFSGALDIEPRHGCVLLPQYVLFCNDET